MNATSPSSTSGPAIAPLAEYKGVAKMFAISDRRIIALENFSLEIHDGEVLVLMGPSGCGKSTALSLLAGHFPPTSGTISFRGATVREPDSRRPIVFQQETLWPWRSVKANLLFSLECRALKRTRGVRRLGLETLMLFSLLRQRTLKRLLDPDEMNEALEWLSTVGLEDFQEALPKQLSGGMRKRAELARAYAAKPELLLLDEPFGNLDALLREEMQDVLGTLLTRAKPTVLFVTHDSREAVAVGDRVAVMTQRPGRIARIIPIDLPRPRTAEIRHSPEFAELSNSLHDLVASPTKLGERD